MRYALLKFYTAQIGKLVTYVSEQPVGPIFKGQSLQEECQEHFGTQLYKEWCGR
jgi:hypothetical protein